MTTSVFSIPSFLRSGLAIALVSALTACGGGGGNTAPSTPTTPSYGGALTPGSVTLTVTNQVTMTTNYGVIVVGLDATHAPASTANFLAYVKSGFYNATIFHRVVAGFVAQGGGYSGSNGTYTLKGTNAAIGLESRNGLSNTQYTLAMARTSDPNSATDQFYFNLVNNASSLDYPSSDSAGYAVFGAIATTDTASITTLNKIAAVNTATNAYGSNWPVADVVVTSVVQNF